MSSTTNNDSITIPNFGDITNIPSSFSYNGGEKEAKATLRAPSGLEQYYCTAKDLNDISLAINNISNYLNQGKTSTTSVYTKEYIDRTFYTKGYISGNYYTKTDINEILTNYYTKSYISANYYTNSYITDNYYTQTDIRNNYYTKDDIISGYYTKSYITKNYYTKTETIAQIVNAYKTQEITLPVDNISIKTNDARKTICKS